MAIAHAVELGTPRLAGFYLESGATLPGRNEFLVASGMFAGAIKHLNDDDRNQLTVETMSTEAMTTSEIEGVIRRPIQRQLASLDPVHLGV